MKSKKLNGREIWLITMIQILNAELDKEKAMGKFVPVLQRTKKSRKKPSIKLAMWLSRLRAKNMDK
jgi:hypothetical protein